MAATSRIEMDRVKKAVSDLAVSFENVVVLVNRYDPTTEKTIAYSAMEGNRYAAVGHVTAWLNDMAGGADEDCECGECGRDGDGDGLATDEDGDTDSRGNR